ncbi:hypothetical protein BU24DRAFT_454556 [Aaosphaeria arxii CBS 175.79]|uniref:Fork-head domain-containing protein n=1 Tax=Aaosphaeria arxii CBS 175.79 TaxID=1450172 RepID=A0A6A5XF99_9PLEO|nr:uncharacterized protein BU24DRAFT_454556 [Aaosphaeria arxii CBS 175.79]KAF2011054.1 hypothetical protein BU24DRAFT_454556 [Aaosphaeria arxii CBS 175.79]
MRRQGKAHELGPLKFESSRDLPRPQSQTQLDLLDSLDFVAGDADNFSFELFTLSLDEDSSAELQSEYVDELLSPDFDLHTLNTANLDEPSELNQYGMLSGTNVLSRAPLSTTDSNGSALQNGLPSATATRLNERYPSDLFPRAGMEVATAANAPAPDAVMSADTLPPFEGATEFPDAIPQSLPISTIPADLPPLDAPIALDQPMSDAFAASYVPDMTAMQMSDVPMNDYAVTPEDRLSAFARLRFSDGNYYMHTYQIILGRNVQLARKDMLRLKRAKERGDSGGDTSGRKRKRGHHRPRSVISNTGGIVNAAVAALPVEYQQRRQSVTENSHDSNSNHAADPNQADAVEQAPQDVLMEAFAPVPQQLEGHVPENPHDCPTVPIHPADINSMSTVQGPKGISRQHAKIAYNFDKRYFELEVLSRNGLYHEDRFYRAGDAVRLNHGDTIVIGAVDMTFTLPEVALTDEDRARQGPDSRPMSFSFENGQGELESDDMYDESASEGTSVNPRHIFYSLHPSDSDMDDMAEDEVDDEEDDEDDEDDEPLSPVPRHKKKKFIKKPAIKQKLKISLKNKPLPPQHSRKESKSFHKRKIIREPSPESPDEEPLAKRAKKKPKEVSEEPPKEKGKAPAKTANKIPIKEPPKASSPEKPEPQETPMSESPTLAKKPVLENAATADDTEQDGIITAEIARQHGLPDTLIGQVLEKRKGPGRPPKDGVMSKRQRAQLIKHHKEMEKAKAAGIDITTIPAPAVKPKIARARKDSTSNALEGDDDDIRESTERGENAANSTDKKPNKPSKPPRTPSPELKVEDYTEEQLQRPSANYVVLIHEAISSSATGQMNLQQIYNYIEKKYPWYKFKTTTSGWQSSVRHNLGQHDAFVKGDKEGKGYNWKINPEVSIEKERRKRQVSPQASHVPRQGYYPPPNGYPAYGQPGAPPYYPGLPQGIPNPGPRPPPSVESVQPRLPPSLARNAASATAPASQAAPNPSPYSSPWAGGNPAGSPAAQAPPRPYPQHPNAQATPGGGPPAAPNASGQYGVLMPTNGPYSASPYGNQYASTGASPYANAANRTYSPYAAAASSSATPQAASAPSQYPNSTASAHSAIPQPPPANTHVGPHPSGRYPISTDLAVITQLEAFRTHYLEKTTLDRRLEEVKVDNAIRAVVNPGIATGVTDEEQRLVIVLQNFLSQIGIKQLPRAETQEPKKDVAIKQEETNGRHPSEPQIQANTTNEVKSQPPPPPATTTASTAAAIAASDAAVAASGQPQQSSSHTSSQPPQEAVANTTTKSESQSSPWPPATSVNSTAENQPNASSAAPATGSTVNGTNVAVPSPVSTHTARPSVEPLTPVPGSPAVPGGSLVKQALTQFNEQTDNKVSAPQPTTDDTKAGAPENSIAEAGHDDTPKQE